MKKEKKNKLPFKQRLFNKMLEKPITDITIVTYDLYKNACRVYLDEKDILCYEDYCILIKEKLQALYSGVDDVS